MSARAGSTNRVRERSPHRAVTASSVGSVEALVAACIFARTSASKTNWRFMPSPCCIIPLPEST